MAVLSHRCHRPLAPLQYLANRACRRSAMEEEEVVEVRVNQTLQNTVRIRSRTRSTWYYRVHSLGETTGELRYAYKVLDQGVVRNCMTTYLDVGAIVKSPTLSSKRQPKVHGPPQGALWLEFQLSRILERDLGSKRPFE